MAGAATAGAPRPIESLRLEPGSHSSPDEGVCIVELASILGRERFSDEPDCVCAVIGAFLRSWNDRASYSVRQRLRPYATRIVGTRDSRAITRRRRDICLVWSELAALEGGPISRSLARLRARVRIGWRLGLGSALRLKRGAGEYAALACFSQHGSEAAFRLLDRLLGAGGGEQSHTNGNGHANGNGHTEDSAAAAKRAFVHAVIRARLAAEKRGSDSGDRVSRPESPPAARR
jgi:hypothetical protein